MKNEQSVLDAFERGKAFGFAEGMKSMRCEMNNEPVAYVNSMCNDYIDWKVEPMSIDGKSLYTHPVKELTDEEIMELSYMTSDNDPIDFARAILRKASEK